MAASQRERILKNLLEESTRALKDKFCKYSNTEELFASFYELIAISRDDLNVLEIKGEPSQFKAIFECKLKNQEDIASFVINYANTCNETLRINSSPHTLSEDNIYTDAFYYRCQHKTRCQSTMDPVKLVKEKPSKRIKNTNCPFSLIFKIKRNSATTFPCVVILEWNHNHPTQALQSLSFRDIPKDVSNEIKRMYEISYTPGLAYREFIKNIRKSCQDDLEFHLKLADRSKIPRRRDFNNLYTEFNKKKYGSSFKEVFNTLEERVKELQQSNEELTIKCQLYNEEENSPFILSIISPLMKRIHNEVLNASEMVFFDSSSNMEEYNLRVFVMVTHSAVGALPLGIVITSDETTDTLVQALDLFKSCLTPTAFHNNGPFKGPLVIMTDNCSELRDALSQAWPSSILLLCTFHLLQQVWRWLFDKNHGVEQQDRPKIMLHFKKIVYAETEEEMDTEFSELVESEELQRYTKLSAYLESLYDIKASWALCYRSHLRIRGNNTNNAIESQFLVLKDEILNRTKEVNINALLEKLLTSFEDHYKVKLLNISSGKFDGTYSSRFKGISKKSCEGVGYKLPAEKVLDEIIQKVTVLGSNLFSVPSFSEDGVEYTVDMDASVCECTNGLTGAACKHQYLIWSRNICKTNNFLPYLNAAQRKEFAYLAIGETLSDEYYEGIHDRIRENEIAELNNTGGSSYDIEFETNDDQVEINKDTYHRLMPVEKITLAECKNELNKTFEHISSTITNSNDPNLLTGFMKFCDRAKSYTTSRLASAFHSFGSEMSSSQKVTSLSSKKRKRGKIHVQPEAIKRRKITSSGTKNALVKGMSKKKNPFVFNVQTKRPHKFSQNVNQNENVPKKAGRSMASRTRKINEKVSTSVKNEKSV